MDEYIKRSDAVQCARDVANDFKNDGLSAEAGGADTVGDWLQDFPAADVRPVPEGGIGEMSDGYHTFNGLAADAIPHVCECCIGCEVESGGCDNAFVLSPKRAKEYLSKPRWIPVTERLPKAERKSYWVCTDTGYQCQCRWSDDIFGIGAVDDWSFSIFDIPQYQKVVAWMPLPCPYEPPKEET